MKMQEARGEYLDLIAAVHKLKRTRVRRWWLLWLFKTRETDREFRRRLTDSFTSRLWPASRAPLA